MNNNLYVGNLPFSVTEESLTALFSEYGKLKNVNIIKDMYTGQTKGFGFVEFVNPEDAKKALELDGKDFSGRPLKVNPARPKETGGRRSSSNSNNSHSKNNGRSRDSRW